MHYPLNVPKRAMKLLGCMRSGKKTTAMLMLVGLSQHHDAHDGEGDKKLLAVVDAHQLENIRDTLPELGARMRNIQLVALDAENLDHIRVADLETVVFLVSAIDTNGSLSTYLPASQAIHSLCWKLGEPTAISPYIIVTAHSHDNIHHPASAHQG